jgi:hypothetical protein
MHEQSQLDPDLLLIQMPFLDLLNHSRAPNCGIFPYVDKLDNDSSFLVLRALDDIPADTQLTVNYGSLSNIHFLQKYGFTLNDPEQEDFN